ncbi:MAG: hypothetical protein PHI52_05080 [Bacteroidales bacterium]|nr:hypothetical protein [Bacteroidales bacterium]
MKEYVVNNFKVINYQYAVGQSLPITHPSRLPKWGGACRREGYNKQSFFCKPI